MSHPDVGPRFSGDNELQYAWLGSNDERNTFRRAIKKIGVEITALVERLGGYQRVDDQSLEDVMLGLARDLVSDLSREELLFTA